MRILIINQPFYPDIVATAQHLADWSEHLTAQGHEVTVIASRSVYGKQGANLPKRDTYKGATVYRVGANLFKKGRILTRLVDFGLFHFLALYRALTLPKQDVVVCLTTPPFIGLVGMLTKCIRGSCYIQYEMDLYPDVPIALGVMRKSSLPARFFDALHRKLLRSADRVVVLGRCMQRVIAAKNIPAEKLALITPWADPDELAPAARESNGFRRQQNLADKFVVMYSGNLGLGHDITTIAAGMQQLANSADPRDKTIHFVFIGGGKRMQEIEAFVDQHHLQNVSILDYQPREKLAETLSAADVHLITQAPGTSGLIVPSKFYGILAAGRPSIYIGPADTEVAYALTESNLGTVLPIGDVQGFLNALHQLQDPSNATEFEARARDVLRQNFSRQVNTAKLTELVESLEAPAASALRHRASFVPPGRRSQRNSV
ncbi:MAG TPA: glycosyltransferase family 4 protein [Phycisphaerae bacterium]|nr:glycosyltransferase family 4 protein [Phycisphaerae bacterium]